MGSEMCIRDSKAIARPMPLLAPVTIATLVVSGTGFCSIPLRPSWPKTHANNEKNGGLATANDLAQNSPHFALSSVSTELAAVSASTSQASSPPDVGPYRGVLPKLPPAPVPPAAGALFPRWDRSFGKRAI